MSMCVWGASGHMWRSKWTFIGKRCIHHAHTSCWQNISIANNRNLQISEVRIMLLENLLELNLRKLTLYILTCDVNNLCLNSYKV